MISAPPKRLSPRLEAVGRAVPAGCVPVDVGSHHGALPARLLAAGRVERCYATEVRRTGYQGPTALAGLELRYGDGLAALTPEDRPDTVVVAGMGARTMLRILAHPRAGHSVIRRWVLQPQTEWARVRRWLRDRSFRLVSEELIREQRRDYLVLAAEPARDSIDLYRGPELSERDLLEVGPLLLARRDPSLEDHWRRRLARARAILTRARGAGRARARHERDLAVRVLELLRGTL